MTHKEKEKLWLKVVKELSKPYGWKFKGWFIFRKDDDLFFSADFFVSNKKGENSIKIGLNYKPYSIDNTFWAITDDTECNDEPLSFRAEAWFCIMGFKFQEYQLEIKDELNPSDEIEAVLKAIEEEVVKKNNAIRSLSDYRAELLKAEGEKIYSGVGEGIVTSLIEEGLYDEALAKMDQYKAQNKSSNLCFGSSENDFYTVAHKYCKKKR